MNWEDPEHKLSSEEAQLFEQAKKSLERCPPEQQLRGYLYDALPPDVYGLTKAHVDDCLLCAARVDRIKVKDNRPAEIQPAVAGTIWKNILSPDQKKKTLSEKIAVFFASLNPLRAAAAFAAVFVVVVGVLVYRQSLAPEIGTNQGSRPTRGEIELIAPDRIVTALPIPFAWEKVPGAAYYELKILDATDKVALSLPRLTSHAITLARESLAELQSGKSYFWEVKAYTAQGELLAASVRKELKVAP